MAKQISFVLSLLVILFLISSIAMAGTIELPKTGQTTSYATGDDGDLKRGVAWPILRFTDNGNGTVTDNLTGLMWAKDGNLPNATVTWQGALDYIASLNSGAGLAGFHDWRLPNRKEFFSLIDYSNFVPALPTGHSFANVQSNYYWSSSTYAFDNRSAWLIGMSFGNLNSDTKSSSNYYVWPVRAGQSGLFGPLVISGNPISGEQGNIYNVTITGSKFTGATGVSFGSGITVNSFTVDSDTQVTANITIDSSAIVGTRVVSVTTPAGTGTLTNGFTINIMTSSSTTSTSSTTSSSTTTTTTTTSSTSTTGGTGTTYS